MNVNFNIIKKDRKRILKVFFLWKYNLAIPLYYLLGEEELNTPGVTNASIIFTSYFSLWLTLSFILIFFISTYKKLGFITFQLENILILQKKYSIEYIEEIAIKIVENANKLRGRYHKEGINNFVKIFLKNGKIGNNQILLLNKNDEVTLRKVLVYYELKGIDTCLNDRGKQKEL